MTAGVVAEDTVQNPDVENTWQMSNLLSSVSSDIVADAGNYKFTENGKVVINFKRALTSNDTGGDILLSLDNVSKSYKVEAFINTFDSQANMDAGNAVKSATSDVSDWIFITRDYAESAIIAEVQDLLTSEGVITVSDDKIKPFAADQAKRPNRTWEERIATAKRDTYLNTWEQEVIANIQKDTYIEVTNQVKS